MPISEAGTLTITPEDISLDNHFFDAFGKMETEVSARWLVRFALERGEGWKPFTDDDINAYYRKTFPQGTFGFNGLDRNGWLKLSLGGHYNFTEEFISRCYKSASRQASRQQ